jgi:heptose I phosphotransferase
MHALTAPFPFLAGCGLILGLLLGARAWRRSGRRRAFVAYHPAWRAFLRRQRLTEPEHFLDLPALLVSGHPGRNVARVVLGHGPDAVPAYLKRERCLPRGGRLLELLAGFGPVSRSLREAQVLQALRREGLAGPEWLAAGEDGRGRAFLLVRAVPGAVDLPTLLRRQPDGAARRCLARRLGAALVRLHDAGFEHRDLYAKHVLVEPGGAVHLLDWQRARRHYVLSGAARARDLAALHATLADELAGPRERLACLRAYLGGLPQAERPPLPAFLAAIEARARRLLARRHVREKRQARAPARPQGWLCLDGEALCVTPALRELCPGDPFDWLALRHQPAPAAGSLARRWLLLPGGRLALLVRRRGRRWLEALWCRLTGRPLLAPEQRQAALLLRLERHAVAAPHVLAMGQRQEGPGQVESFLLTEPARDTVRLEAWLARRHSPHAEAAVLRQAGALLHRLHESSCYLDGPGATSVLAVRLSADADPALVLDSAEGVSACRGRRPGRARRDLNRLLEQLRAAGCSAADLRRFLDGYRPAGPPAPAAGASPAPVPGTAVVNRETLWQRLLRGARRLRQRPDWDRFAGPGWADRIMDVAVTDRFHAKQGRSTGRWVLQAPGPEGGPPRRLTVYLKRHYQLPRWQGLLAALWPRGDWSPAFQEWNHLEWARRQGVPVPAVVAAGELAGPHGRLQSFLAVEELTDMLPLHEAIPLAAARLGPTAFRRWKRGLVAEMARLARMLHDRRCFHKDLYLCHFYIHRDLTAGPPPEPPGAAARAGPRDPAAGWRGRVHLIDLHRLAHHPWTWRLWQLKDLAQLLYSSEVAGVDARDQVCFWRYYRGLGPRRRSDRWLRRCVLFKWRRYRQHNLRRKARRSPDEG